MGQIGFFELLLILIIAILVLGPERLPIAAKKAGEIYSRITNMWQNLGKELKEGEQESRKNSSE